jgi:DNA-binding transcriptional LysR family regulator
MDIADLDVFMAVAQEGGMTRASGVLHTVQSNVTARIRRLETELAVPLFHRHKRGVTLTAAGERLIPYAEKMRSLLFEAKASVSPSSEPSGSLRIGSLETTAALRLHPLLTRYGRKYPEVEFSLITGSTAFLMEEVAACRLEGAFVAGPMEHPSLVSVPAFSEKLVLYTPVGVGDPIRFIKSNRPRALVFRVGCTYRQRLESVFVRAGACPIKFLEFGSLDGIMSCVSAGLGVTMLPEVLSSGSSWWARWRASIAVKPVPAEDSIVPTVFVRRAGSHVSSAMAKFLESIGSSSASSKRPR